MTTAFDLNGIRTQGKDVRMANITAVQSLAAILKTSLGPQGLDKMLVDEIGDVTITNDGATILRQIEVEHPAAKIMVQLSQLQDKEVGDGTTSVVIMAAELLKKANDLIKNHVHPSTIIAGYKLASKQAIQFIKENLAVSVESLGQAGLINIAKTSMSSKFIGGEAKLFSELAVKAINAVKGSSGKYPIKHVNIVKAHGQSILESDVFNGYVLRMGRVSQQMPTKIEGAKIACLDFSLSKFRLAMGVQVLVNDPKNLEDLRKREMDILKERLEKIIAAGANVIFTTKAMDDVAAKYLVEKNVLGLRRIEHSQLSKIAKATGATLVTTMANSEGNEVFEENFLGEAEVVYEENLGDTDYVFVKGCKGGEPVCSLILRGANETLLDEVDRSLHDVLCVLKRTLESGRVVAGGGAVEAAISVYLDNSSQKSASNEQIAISEFSEAMLVIPKQLALNAAKDASELVSKLLMVHSTFQNYPGNKKYENFQFCGLDLLEGKIKNNLERGVLEPEVSKIKAIKFATEAAIAILRIDDMIKLGAEKEDQPHRR